MSSKLDNQSVSNEGGQLSSIITSSGTPDMTIKEPMVFCCGKCHSIIGDSFALTGTHAQLKTITLSGVSKVSRNDELVTSKASLDKGSTYLLLDCGNCHEIIGRYYLTTPRELDALRERFTFLVDKINSYILGKPQYGDSMVSSVDNPSEAVSNQGVAENENLLKIQHVILAQEERIAKLEQTLALLVQPVILSHNQEDNNSNNNYWPVLPNSTDNLSAPHHSDSNRNSDPSPSRKRVKK